MKAKHCIGMIGLLALALTACGGPSAVPANGQADGVAVLPPVSQPSAEEAQILAQINAARAQPRSCDSTHHYAAAAPLTWNARLGGAAWAHSDDMARNGYHEATAQDPEAPHQGSDGSSPQDRITQAGYDWRMSGENVAAGFKPTEVVAAWLASPGHCENIMNPAFKDIGISYVAYPGAVYDTFYPQDFGSQ